MVSLAKRSDGRWRARYRDDDNKEHSRHFRVKKDAEKWLAMVEADRQRGTYVSPEDARITVGEFADRWLLGYESRRASTVRQAEVHLRVIRAKWGRRQLRSIRPSDVQAWGVELRREYAPSTAYAIYRRFAQIMLAAVRDGILVRSPCSRDTSPPQADSTQRAVTSGQVWALHDAMPDNLRPAVLLAAYAGLRVGEVCGLRVSDIDFDRAVIRPSVQWPAEPLKTRESRAAVPITDDLADMLRQHVGDHGGEWVIVNAWGKQASPAVVEAAFRDARRSVEGVPERLRIHDLRHHYAAFLIGCGLDIKTVQARLRHRSAMTTLDVYGHLIEDDGASTRAAIREQMTARADYLRTSTGGSTP